jgi:PAS domain S-box-containing protein
MAGAAFLDRVGWNVDDQRTALDQDPGHGLASPFEDAADGRARNAHALGGILLIESFVIAEAQGFPGIGAEMDLDQFMHGDAAWLEHQGARVSGDPALALRTSHARVMSMCAEPASAESPCHQATILDAITEGVFTVDAQWRITSFNRAAETITGISRSEAIGQPCRAVFRASVCDGHCALRETMERGEAIHCRRIEIVDADGNRRPVSVSTNLLHGPDGQVVGGVETFRDLRQEEALRKAIRKDAQIGDLVAVSSAMRRVLDVLPAIAGSSTTVLVSGESGTGKELVARALHRLSPRKRKPFIAVNCGALPDQLLESELFGHVAGAFTDAKRDKPGRFALAEGGTLFLDEIGEISPAMQVHLLRVLQERTYEPLGGTRTLTADVRIIAASNRDLAHEVRAGRFREDLFYRIAVVPVHLPPLRERVEDIPLLAEHLLERLAAREDKPIPTLSDAARAQLVSWHWPGNVRELANALERAWVLCQCGIIQAEHLPHPAQGTTPDRIGKPLANAGRSAEAATLMEALRQHGWNRLATAQALGVHKTTLFRKLRQLGLNPPRAEDEVHDR